LGSLLGAAPFLYELITEFAFDERALDFKPAFFLVIFGGVAISSAVIGAIIGWVGQRPELVGGLAAAGVLGAFAATLSLISGGELELVSSLIVAGGVGFLWGVVVGALVRAIGRVWPNRGRQPDENGAAVAA
jgi:hypothetical protein